MRFFYLDMLSAKYKIKFHMALHIEIETDSEDTDHYKQYLQLRSFFFINLKNYLVDPEIEGVWSLPADVFKKFIIEYFQLNPHDISLTKGDWSKDFDTAFLNKS
jgi:predicted NAD/FAD-binding protein